ncbi:MAG TPA: FAD-binding oxidoreductase, partial [Gemmatimonadales bacterium]|nr:FAD-binding oxidoreductase [Gemmatimonadales bacterium]
MTGLITLRHEVEQTRFRREQIDDSRTAIPAGTVKSLEKALRAEIRGEVHFDDGFRALYATDASNYRQVPIGVVIPRDVEDVIHAVAAAREHGAPVLSRGGGTSLAGQCCNVGLVLDFSKYLIRVLEIDPDRRTARVEPGVILDDLRNAAQAYGLTFGPDPATHSRNTLGGMLGNNSCGVHSLLCRKSGRGLRTSDNTHSLAVLTYDGLGMEVGPTSDDDLERLTRGAGRRGEIYRALAGLRDRYADRIRRDFPQLPRRVSGYNLDELLPENGFNVARALVGTESTCVTILEATLDLVPNPGARSLLVLGYPDVFATADHLMQILDLDPTALEGMDHLLFEWISRKGDERANLSMLPEGRGWLLVEFGGDSKEDADQQAHQCMEMLKRQDSRPTMRLLDDPHEERMIWEVRESGLGATAWVPGQPDSWPGFEDSAVPPARVGEYLRDLKSLMNRYGLNPSLYGHFG